LNEAAGGIGAQSLEIPLEMIFGEAVVSSGLLIAAIFEPPYGPGVYGDLDVFLLSGQLRGFDRQTGDTVWESGDAGFSIAHQEDLVFTANDVGSLTALKASDGTTQWTRDVSGNGMVVAPEERGPILLGTGSQLFAFNPRDGADLWSRPLPDGGGFAASSDLAFLTSPEGMEAVSSASGDVVWSLSQPAATRGSLLYSDRRLYSIGDSDLICIDAETGTELMRESVDGFITQARSTDGRLAVTAEGGPSSASLLGDP
jgi:outer membrane protein assembly factor BamB